MTTPEKIGRYEILEELGRGAMGTVYRAKDPAMDRIVAIKTIISVALASEQGEEFRERLFREARAAGQLTHPGIVPVFDVGEHEGSPFMVMEYVEGWTLARAAGQGERLDLNRMCTIGEKIAEALGYAHQRGVVHRDIKPANILLTSRQAYGVERPKITDFGIAKLTENGATMTGKMLGTPAFMPPEQFTGAPLDGRADIFSLGVVLYWLATGEQPFPGEGLTAILYKVVHTDPIPPRKLNPALPEKFESLVLKCMEKDPANRYQTAEELASALSELRSGKVAAAPAPAPRVIRPVNEADATIVEPVQMVRPPAVAPSPLPTTKPNPAPANPAPAPQRKSPLLAIAIAALAVAACVAWFAIRKFEKKTPPPPAVATIPAARAPATAPATTPAAPIPVSPVVPASSAAANTAPATVRPASPASAASKPPKTAHAAQPKATAASPTAAPLGFDPATLDPKENARLKADAQGMPAGLAFTVEMDGKIYSQNAGGVDKTSFVPPGVHQFQVTASSGSVKKTSNSESLEFKQKKHYTLRVELHIQGMPASAGMPQGLYPSSQIVVSLK